MSTHSGGVRSRLEDVSLETVAQHPEHLHRTSLDGLPEDLALRLFERILALGRLTPRLLEIFEAADHELLTARISQLGIRKWIPPVLPGSQGPWLGQKPPLW